MSERPASPQTEAEEDRPLGRRRLTLDAFIRRRLGSDGSDLDQLGRMFGRSFGAGSFAGFWRYWNPVYAYYLDRFCYRPLRRRLPRPLAALATFACSGFFLHDLPFWWGVAVLKTRTLPIPFVALWFALMGGLMLVEERTGLDYSARPLCLRVVINTAHIAAAALVALAIVRLAS